MSEMHISGSFSFRLLLLLSTKGLDAYVTGDARLLICCLIHTTACQFLIRQPGYWQWVGAHLGAVSQFPEPPAPRMTICVDCAGHAWSEA